MQNWLSALIKSLLPTILTWATKKGVKIVQEAIDRRKAAKERKLEVKRNKRLEFLEIQLQEAIRNRDEKEIIRLNIAINNLKL
jgi:hypothetical protein